MLRSFLRAKIRDLSVTSTNLEYQGSIMLDEKWLDEAGILPDEQVHVLNTDNGERLITYALRGKKGSGVVELNGAAARCAQAGDRIMVLTYCMLNEDEIATHKPTIISINPPKKQPRAPLRTPVHKARR